jgi:flagellar hook-length control protein FliK
MPNAPTINPVLPGIVANKATNAPTESKNTTTFNQVLKNEVANKSKKINSEQTSISIPSSTTPAYDNNFSNQINLSSNQSSIKDELDSSKSIEDEIAILDPKEPSAIIAFVNQISDITHFETRERNHEELEESHQLSDLDVSESLFPNDQNIVVANKEAVSTKTTEQIELPQIETTASLLQKSNPQIQIDESNSDPTSELNFLKNSDHLLKIDSNSPSQSYQEIRAADYNEITSTQLQNIPIKELPSLNEYEYRDTILNPGAQSIELSQAAPPLANSINLNQVKTSVIQQPRIVDNKSTELIAPILENVNFIPQQGINSIINLDTTKTNKVNDNEIENVIGLLDTTRLANDLSAEKTSLKFNNTVQNNASYIQTFDKSSDSSQLLIKDVKGNDLNRNDSRNVESVSNEKFTLNLESIQTPPPVATKAEAIPLPTIFEHIAPRVGTKGWDQAVGQKIVWMVAGGEQSAQLTLNPPDLGPVQVVLSISDNFVDASFVSSHLDVREAIESAAPKLREMMENAGISLSGFSVSAESAQSNNQFSAEKSFRNTSSQTTLSSGTDIESDQVLSTLSNRNTGRDLGLVDTFV